VITAPLRLVPCVGTRYFLMPGVRVRAERSWLHTPWCGQLGPGERKEPAPKWEVLAVNKAMRAQLLFKQLRVEAGGLG
jgi:hypothetical protein